MHAITPSQSLNRPQALPQRQPIVIHSGLMLNPAWPTSFSPAAMGMAELASTFRVELLLDEVAINRLLALHDALVAIDADQIEDWNTGMSCIVTAKGPAEAPKLVGVGAAVYADGDVFISVNLDGVGSSLWLLEPLNLNAISTGQGD